MSKVVQLQFRQNHCPDINSMGRFRLQGGRAIQGSHVAVVHTDRPLCRSAPVGSVGGIQPGERKEVDYGLYKYWKFAPSISRTGDHTRSPPLSCFLSMVGFCPAAHPLRTCVVCTAYNLDLVFECHFLNASWLLAVPSKIGEEITLLLNKNKPGTAGFENPQPSQIPKDAKMKK